MHDDEALPDLIRPVGASEPARSEAPPLAGRGEPLFLQLHEPDSAAQRSELRASLLGEPPCTPPKILYDALGSRLFEAITELPEYYPTRIEAAIFERFADEMAEAVGTGGTLIDLGAGNCQKAASLFSAFRPARYVAVDISVDFLRQSLGSLQRRYPRIDMLGIGLDFSNSLNLPPPALEGRRIFFYPGSSIGNFTPREAMRFLRDVRNAATGGGLLIGVDLLKPADALEPAYNDALGVTGAFNLNVLLHLNRLIGSDFDVREWRHVALFNRLESRMEMHLEARIPVTVRWPGGRRDFIAGERIHTESSYKYPPESFAALLRDAGFPQVRAWYDPQRWCAVFWATA
jgi:dimethylhistidine N-methyltransferase